MWLEEVSFHVTLCVWTDCACDLLEMFWDPFCGLWMPMELSWQTTYSQTIVKTMFVRTTAFWHAVPSGIKVLAEKIGREPMHQVLKHQVSSKVAHRFVVYLCIFALARMLVSMLFMQLRAGLRSWAPLADVALMMGYGTTWSTCTTAPPNFHEPFLEKQKDTKETYLYI